MAGATGVSAIGGAPLSDWQHTEQSIAKILTTPIGSRVMRREFGSRLHDLIDAKMVQRNVLALYVAAAEAIARWEPRFALTVASIDETSPNGRVTLQLHGTYFPRGHLGDFSVAEDASTRVVINAT